MNTELTIEAIIEEAARFADAEGVHDEPLMFGITDGKAVGTYLEKKFIKHLKSKYQFVEGSSALGIDLPEVNVDIKVTSKKLPQSSSPFRSAKQRIYGLGHGLIIFVYEKQDDDATKTARFSFTDIVFIHKERTGDYEVTRGIREILERNGSKAELLEFMKKKAIPSEELHSTMANEILENKPEQGYLNIYNALQWRLFYSFAIQEASRTEGIDQIR